MQRQEVSSFLERSSREALEKLGSGAVREQGFAFDLRTTAYAARDILGGVDGVVRSTSEEGAALKKEPS